jgi:hypothetical protein
MASQVLSGPSNPTYTNNTGQNVRVVINYMRSLTQVLGQTPNIAGQTRIPDATETLTLNWAGVSVTYSDRTLVRSASTLAGGSPVQQPPNGIVIGRNIAYLGQGGPFAATNAVTGLITNPPNVLTLEERSNEINRIIAFPTELILAPNQTFSAVCGVHNVVIIPENG